MRRKKRKNVSVLYSSILLLIVCIVADGGSMHAMDCVDVIIGAARGNQYRILDYYTRDRSTPMLDNEYGGTQDLTGAIGQEVDGITTIIFRRKMQSGTYFSRVYYNLLLFIHEL